MNICVVKVLITTDTAEVSYDNLPLNPVPLSILNLD